MGNQQEKLIWLAGLIDGDGCVGIFRCGMRRQKVFTPSVQISLTCRLTYEYLDDMFKFFQFGHHWTIKKPQKKTHKPIWNVEIKGLRRVRKLIENIGPYLVTKKREAELVYKYITSRLSKSQKAPYSKEELDWIDQIHKIKLTRNSYCPQRPYVGRLEKTMIWSELMRKPESVAEMSTPC